MVEKCTDVASVDHEAAHGRVAHRHNSLSLCVCVCVCVAMRACMRTPRDDGGGAAGERRARFHFEHKAPRYSSFGQWAQDELRSFFSAFFLWGSQSRRVHPRTPTVVFCHSRCLVSTRRAALQWWESGKAGWGGDRHSGVCVCVRVPSEMETCRVRGGGRNVQCAGGRRVLPCRHAHTALHRGEREKVRRPRGASAWERERKRGERGRRASTRRCSTTCTSARQMTGRMTLGGEERRGRGERDERRGDKATDAEHRNRLPLVGSTLNCGMLPSS